MERLTQRTPLKRLRGVLETGETVHVVATGTHKRFMGTDGLTVLTDRRLMFVTAREDRDVFIRLGDIRSVDASTGRLYLKLTVLHGKQSTTIASLDPDRGEQIVAMLRRAICDT